MKLPAWLQRLFGRKHKFRGKCSSMHSSNATFAHRKAGSPGTLHAYWITVTPPGPTPASDLVHHGPSPSTELEATREPIYTVEADSAPARGVRT